MSSLANSEDTGEILYCGISSVSTLYAKTKRYSEQEVQFEPWHEISNNVAF